MFKKQLKVVICNPLKIWTINMSTPSDDYCNETVTLPPLMFTNCDDMQTVVITLGVFLGVTFVTLATQSLFYAYRVRNKKTQTT